MMAKTALVCTIICVLGIGCARFPSAHPPSGPVKTAYGFVLLPDGCILDTVTGKKWAIGNHDECTWQEARKWAGEVKSDGGGWRMPCLHELENLCKRVPISWSNGFFDRIINTCVWSCRLQDTYTAWVYSFPDCRKWLTFCAAFRTRPLAVKGHGQ